MEQFHDIKEHYASQKLLIGITGSIAALGVPQFLIIFGQIFKEVKVIMTPAACHFIPPSSIEYLCNEVFVDSERGHSHAKSHVELARWADEFFVLPATANTLGHVANGLAHNLLTQTLLCYEGNPIFFPSMNSMMWRNPSLQRNIKLLLQDGRIICPPVERESFEQASKSMRKNHILPSIIEVLQFLSNHIKTKSNPLEVAI